MVSRASNFEKIHRLSHIFRHNIRHTYTHAQASTLVYSVASPKSEDLGREASSLCTALDAGKINVSLLERTPTGMPLLVRPIHARPVGHTLSERKIDLTEGADYTDTAFHHSERVPAQPA